MTFYSRCKCGVKIAYGKARCEECELECKSRHKRYNETTRYTNDNKKYATFYNGVAWRRMRSLIVLRYNGLCLYSLMMNNEVVQADCIHHIKPIRESYEERLRESNLIPLSHETHNMVHSRMDAGDMSVVDELYSCLDKYVEEYEQGFVN